MEIQLRQDNRPSLSGFAGLGYLPKTYVALAWIVALAGAGLMCRAQAQEDHHHRPRVGDTLVWNGHEFAPQAKAVLEVRDYDGAGVDCTGWTDSSPFLNSITATPDPTGTSLTISTRDCPLLRADGWRVTGQEYLEIDLGPMGPGTRAHGGTWLFGCLGSGAVLTIDSSGYTKVHGGAIAANSYLCPNHTSSLTSSIRYTNSGVAGGFASTHNTLADTFLTSGVNGESTSGYHAYEIIGPPNQEEYRLENVLMGCQNSPKSAGFYSNDGNADSTTWEFGGAQGCYRMIQIDAGRLRLLHTNNSYNGSFSTFGPGGASIALTGGCVTEMVENVFAEGSGTLMLAATQGSFGCSSYMRGNQASPSDFDPSVHFIETGYLQGTLILQLNSFSLGHSPAILGNGIVGSLPYGGAGLVQVLDQGGNGLTNDAGQSYTLTAP